MTASRYTRQELDRLARFWAKGIGRYLRWELLIGEHVSLVIFVRRRKGTEHAIHIAI